ncbi:SLAM family member 6 isoform X2 [Pogoniulus pusillus]|uniref:SLAM family member 6 isoform X2 n=1 Tax=Pogoniulus pusillus TaxID=488313 RepID=UPI0030B9AD0B
MDAARCLLLTFLLLPGAGSGAGAELVRAVGSSATFQLQGLGEGTAAAWSFHNEIIATVRIGSPPEVSFYDEGFKPRLDFSQDGSTMTIANLGLGDTGNYTAKALGLKATFSLHVYSELEVPTVTCVAQNCSASSCLYLLHCSTSTPGSGSVWYSWSLGGALWSEGATVPVQEPPPEPLLCTAQNAVSNRSLAVPSPTALCAGSVPSGRSRLVAAVAASGALLLLALLLLAVYCSAKGWKFFHPSAAQLRDTGAEVEYATVYAQVGPFQQKEPQKPSPELESSRSIYSTVQALAQPDEGKMGTSMPRCQQQEDKSLYAMVGQAEPLAQPLAQPQHSSTATMSLL